MFTFNDVITAGTVLVRQQIESQNWTPSGGLSGWYIGSDGTASFNNVTVRGAFHIGGPAPIPGIDGFVNGTQPQLRFNSGVTGETQGALIFADVNAGPMQPVIVMSSATTNNGQVELYLGPASTGGFGQATFATVNDTAPVGANGVKAFLNMNPDIQTRMLNGNTNATTNQALMIGAVAGQQLRISSQEIDAYTGGTTPATLFLNFSGGGISAPSWRHTGAATGAAAAVNVASTAYAPLPGVQATSVNITCPVSGILTVAIEGQVGANAAAVVNDFVALCVNITNNTQATTPFAATDNRCTTLTAEQAGALGGNISIGRTYTCSSLGNPGDSLTVAIYGRVGVANRFFVFRTELSVIPSP